MSGRFSRERRSIHAVQQTIAEANHGMIGFEADSARDLIDAALKSNQ